MITGGKLLVYIGYKYTARKVLSFIVTYGADITQSGLPFLSKYPDQFTNVAICPITCPLVMKKTFLLLMRLTPTTNQGSIIRHWISSGLLSVVGCGYVRQLLWE